MDDKTAAEPFAHRAATGAGADAPRGRRRRALAAGSLLLVVAASLSACSSGGKTAVAGSSPSAPTGSVSAPSAPADSGTPSAGGASSAPTAAPSSGSVQGTTPTRTAPTRPGAPASTPPGGTTGSAPGQPSHLKPTGYLTREDQLTVFFVGGICDKYGLRTDESKAGQVGVQVVITQKAPVGQACPALAKNQGVSADLASPLGNRTVVDLDSGANVPLESVPNGGPVSAAN